MYIQNSTVRTSNKPAEWQPELSRGFVWTCPGADLILFFSTIFVFSINIIFRAEAVDKIRN